MISSVPTELRAHDFNGMIEDVNRTRLAPFNLEPLAKIKLSWLFDTGIPFVHPATATSAIGSDGNLFTAMGDTVYAFSPQGQLRWATTIRN